MGTRGYIGYYGNKGLHRLLWEQGGYIGYYGAGRV